MCVHVRVRGPLGRVGSPFPSFHWLQGLNSGLQA